MELIGSYSIEQENNENWVRDASIITNVEANYNEKFKYTFNSAFQSSPTYLRRTNQNNLINRNNTLATELNITGYNLRKFDDNFNFIISGYQVVKNDEDNKTDTNSCCIVPGITHVIFI